jgi:hypothetical protein
MCDDQVHGDQVHSAHNHETHHHSETHHHETRDQETGTSRRRFIKGAAVGAVALAAGGGAAFAELHRRQPVWSSARPVGPDGGRAYSMAMHVHSSFSEQCGSMESQLYQAAKNSVDVLWWTDHDSRMDGLGYRREVHFTSLTKEAGGPGQGGPWKWTKVESGPLTSRSGGGIVENPCSPNDPVAGGSLHLTADSATTTTAKSGYYANCQPAGWNYRDNLTGQSLTIDVLLTSGWTRGYLELLIHSSYHEAVGGRPGGVYALSYRFVPPGTPASRVAQGNLGVVTIPVRPTSGKNPWATVTMTPTDDIAALWPDVDHRDFALWELSLDAASEGDPVGGYFDYLRFTRRKSGEVFLHQQIEMEALLAPRFPSVAQRQGLEVSFGLPHLNWFGGAVAIPDYSLATASSMSLWNSYLETTAVPQIHAAGGLISYNHPYGASDPKPFSLARQDKMLAEVARMLLPTDTSPGALGVDLLEVGYTVRAGVDLAHHVALWDIMSRNGVFLTGNGTNDDHMGLNWFKSANNWITSTWAASTSEADLLASLAAGRAWCSSLSHYRGTLDLLVDNSCPMGSASLSAVNSRQLVATATEIPKGGSLRVIQGAVDHPGTRHVATSTQMVASYAAGDVGGGTVATSIDTSEDSFVRTEVVNARGRVVGLSNPVWLLRKKPPRGIPAARAV